MAKISDNGQQLLYIGHAVAQRERDLETLAFCYDTYVEFVHAGREPKHAVGNETLSCPKPDSGQKRASRWKAGTRK
jgi:hypothetical protein